MAKPETSDTDKSSRARIENSLLDARTIMIFGEINQKVAREVSEKLLVLSSQSAEPIKIFINSQGGHVEAGDTIHDMIQCVPAPVKIVGTGWVASAGALIYSAAKLENRISLPNTRYMLHQPMGGVGGSASDAEIEAREIIKMRRRLNEIFAKQTGRDVEKIEKETDRNYWMSPEEAKDYGLVGKIVTSTSDV